MPIVMENYNQVVSFPKENIPQKEIDWVKINRTQEESKESVDDYYERLMEAFRYTVVCRM